MPSATDLFREQREAAEQLHGRVQEISALLDQLRHHVNSLALNDELRAMLRKEQDWAYACAAGCLRGSLVPGAGHAAVLARRDAPGQSP
jgi:hypothetical protein